MSPVDSPTVEASLSTSKADSTTEGGGDKKPNSGAVVSHTPNGAEPKEKKRKRKRDPPREHDAKDTATDEQAPNADRSSEKYKGGEESRDHSQSKTQPPTEDVPQNAGDKKVKKKEKEKREETQPKQGDTNEENIAPPEPVAPSADDNSKDEKISKKRKHKKEEEATAEPEPLQTGGAEKKKKKKKDKSGVDVIGADHAIGDKRKREGSAMNDGEKRKKKRADVGQS